MDANAGAIAATHCRRSAAAATTAAILLAVMAFGASLEYIKNFSFLCGMMLCWGRMGAGCHFVFSRGGVAPVMPPSQVSSQKGESFNDVILQAVMKILTHQQQHHPGHSKLCTYGKYYLPGATRRARAPESNTNSFARLRKDITRRPVLLDHPHKNAK